ncbi:hypothetical protein [Marinobacter sp. M-5]|uniref:hypothetical protein n=1 Tax=Marinobacter sp. M-5 TaxID=3081089 RepID=UPI00293CF72B|nr:hypothetical protein [Marinobacter sp. M-5]MDV3503566.1 hypothetical protein [Marinobacter sp. M-5]
MQKMNRFIFGVALAAVNFLPLSVAAEEEQIEVQIPENSVLSDGKLSSEELARYAIVGQEQLVRLTEKATQEYTVGLQENDSTMPAAWMLLNDGETIKRINIDGQTGQTPASVRILMYRAALKSIARRGKINAAVILYTGKVKEGEKAEALVIEHEHRLGIAGNKIIPYTIEDGKVFYSQSVTKEKPFEMFYDDRGQAPTNQI